MWFRNKNYSISLDAEGWRLSPMYDVNLVPYGDELALNVNENENRIDVELAVEAADRFGIPGKEARTIAADIIGTVKDNWMRLAKECGLSRGQIEAMRPAFGVAL